MRETSLVNSVFWKLIRFVVWVAALADWANPWPVCAWGGATICSKAWSFSRIFKIRFLLLMSYGM